MKYRKKPVVVEAVQWDGDNDVEIHEFIGEDCFTFHESPFPELRIHTLEGVMIASEGDYIIKGVQGEFYPCKPSIFDETYEALEVEGE